MRELFVHADVEAFGAEGKIRTHGDREEVHFHTVLILHHPGTTTTRDGSCCLLSSTSGVAIVVGSKSFLILEKPKADLAPSSIRFLCLRPGFPNRMHCYSDHQPCKEYPDKTQQDRYDPSEGRGRYDIAVTDG